MNDDIFTQILLGGILIILMASLFFVNPVVQAETIQTNNTNLEEVIFDGAVVGIAFPHYEIHEGDSFTYGDTHIIAKNTQAPDHLIVTPNSTKFAHFTLAIGSTGGQIMLEVFENATCSDNGDLEPLFNRNRNSNKTPTTILYEDPTCSSTGTTIFHATYGVDEKKSAGGEGRGTQEWILKANTKYLVRVTEEDVANTVVNLEFDWYEHTFS